MSRIPIAAAKRIAKEYGIDQVVILGRVPESEPGKGDGTEHVTTYGRTVIHCEIAALMGNKLKRILGWPADRCMDKPRRQRLREIAEVERVAKAIFGNAYVRAAAWTKENAKATVVDESGFPEAAREKDRMDGVARNVIAALEKA